MIYLSVRKLVLSREILSNFTPVSNKICSNSSIAMDHIRLGSSSFSENRSTKLGDKSTRNAEQSITQDNVNSLPIEFRRFRMVQIAQDSPRTF